MRLFAFVLLCSLAAFASAACINQATTTEAPAPCDPVTEAPTQPPCEPLPPCEPVTEAPTQPPCEPLPPCEPVTEAPTQPPCEPLPPCEPVTEAPTQPPCEPLPPCEPVTEAPTQPPCEPVTEPPCEPVTEAPTTTLSPCAARRQNAQAKKKTQPSEVIIDDEEYILVKKNATTPKPKQCNTWDKCYSSDDCGTGTCIGAFIGTCHCYSCVHFYPCTEDIHCGGFYGACDKETNQCDCFGAYKKNGLRSFGHALLDFCNLKHCTADGDNCFGLPCQSGKCICD